MNSTTKVEQRGVWQAKYLGECRYSVKSPVPDTSITGWMVLALKTVKTCSLLRLIARPTKEELTKAFVGALTWFDNGTSKQTGITGYRNPFKHSL